MTNGDVIRNMDDEKLAEFLYVFLEKIKKYYNNEDTVMKCLLNWLGEDYE